MIVLSGCEEKYKYFTSERILGEEDVIIECEQLCKIGLNKGQLFDCSQIEGLNMTCRCWCKQ